MVDRTIKDVEPPQGGDTKYKLLGTYLLTPLRKLHVSPSSAPPGTLRARSDVQWRDSGQKLQSLIADEELKRVEKLVAKLCKGKDIKVERKKKKPVAKGYSRNIGPGQSGQS